MDNTSDKKKYVVKPMASSESEILLHLNSMEDIFKNNILKRYTIDHYAKKLFCDANLFCAYLEKELVGLLAFYNKDDRTLYLTNLSVKQNYRDLGIGRLLMSYLINDGLNNKIRRIEFEIIDTNTRALEFYSKYKAINTKENRYIIKLDSLSFH